MKETCAYVFIDNNGKKFSCQHSTYRGQRFCVFHYIDIHAKSSDFYGAIDELIHINTTGSRGPLDLKGFVFPRYVSKRRVFNCAVDARKAQFLDSVDFEGTVFEEDVNFLGSLFRREAIFQGVKFLKKAQFMGCRFKHRAIFVGGSFDGKAVFHGCKFSQLAVFENRSFNEEAIFQWNTFFEDADFRNTRFNARVDFTGTLFHKRFNFANAQFTNEVKLSDVNIALLKSLPGTGILFDGAVLETANFWQIERLEHYSFKNAFLISCNFAGKEIIDCDFSGAVFKSVHTEGWKPDSATLKNTKYIYTDYKVDEVKGTLVYKPVLDSRVPARGNFGDESNPGYWLTSFVKEPRKWEFLLDLPEQVRTRLVNYLQFFRDYMKATQNLEVAVATHPEGKKVRVSFILDAEGEADIQEALQDYLNLLFRPFNRFDIVFQTKTINDYQKELAIINLQNEILSSQALFRYALQTNEDKYKTIENLLMMYVHKDKEEKRLLIEKIGEQSQTAPTAIAIISDAAKVHTQFDMKIEFSMVLDELYNELSKAMPGNAEFIQTINDIKGEVADLKKALSTTNQTTDSKSRLSKLMSNMFRVIAKAADYGIKNADNIIAILDKIQKLI